MSKYPLNSLHEIRSDLSAQVDKLDYLLADMECKSRSVAQSIDRLNVATAVRHLEEFVQGLDDSVNGKENRAIEAHVELVRSRLAM